MGEKNLRTAYVVACTPPPPTPPPWNERLPLTCPDDHCWRCQRCRLWPPCPRRPYPFSADASCPRSWRSGDPMGQTIAHLHRTETIPQNVQWKAPCTECVLCIWTLTAHNTKHHRRGHETSMFDHKRCSNTIDWQFRGETMTLDNGGTDNNT